MNENDMADLLRGATRDLEPDLPQLVLGGLRRGRLRERRRRAALAVGTGAAVVVLVTGGWQLFDASGTTGRDVPPAGQGRSSETATPTPQPTPRAVLAVTTDEVPSVFASIEPGDVSVPAPKSGPDAAPVVDFTWEGFGIRVGLTSDDYVSGRSVPDPARRCARLTPSAPCRPGPDGTVISTSDATNPAVDGGTRVRSVTVFRPDGWDVLVMAYNGPGKEGPATADEPPLDLEQLIHIATSDRWFR